MSGHRLGASSIAAVVGIDPFRTPQQLWEEMTGRRQREENEQMWRGIYLESGLVDWWAHLAKATDVRKQVRCEYPADKRLGATLDATALVVDDAEADDGDDGLHRLPSPGPKLVAVETKCPRSDGKKTEAGWVKVWGGPDNAHPEHYRLQVVFQLGVARAAGVEVAYGELVAGPLWGELLRFRVDHDAQLFAALVARAQQFLAYVEADEPLPESWGVAA